MASYRPKHVCSACTASFPSGQAFNAHAASCPATPKPTPGESFFSYQKRADAFATVWRAANGKSPVLN